jgi:hypothetical protein
VIVFQLSNTTIVVAVLAVLLGVVAYRCGRMAYRMALDFLSYVASLVTAADQMVTKLSEIAGYLPELEPREPIYAAELCQAGGERVDDAMSVIFHTEPIAAGAKVPVFVGPTRSDLFVGKMMRVVAVAAAAPALRQRVYIQDVTINCTSQLLGAESTRRSDVELGTPSDLFHTPPGYAVPVQFDGPIASKQLVSPLHVEVINPNPYPVLATVEVYGEPYPRPDNHTENLDGGPHA